MGLLFILLISLIITILSGFLIALFTYKKLKRNANKYPWLISTGTFLVSVVIIGGGIIVLVLNNLHFER